VEAIESEVLRTMKARCFKRRVAVILDDGKYGPAARSLYADAQAMLDRIVAGNSLRATSGCRQPPPRGLHRLRAPLVRADSWDESSPQCARGWWWRRR
jgi:hypothetical protein